MGWFWNSSSPKPESSSDAPTQPTTTPPPAVTTPPKPAPAESEAASTDREMAAFMKMLMADTNKSSESSQAPPPPTQQQQTPPPPKPSSWLPSWATTSKDEEPQPAAIPPLPAKTRTPESLAMSEHSLPTTMSCRDAFDYAWHCHTPGSQWNAVYRYGTVRPCTELWDDFWFCMRIKSYSPEMKAEAVRDHYRAKEEAKYGGGKPSSEDVWESREERVKPGTAFSQEFSPPIVDDDEFNRQDAEYRRAVRKMVEERERKEADNNKKE